MEKRRIVFLFGAGATMSWDNAPPTWKITEKILESGFKTIDNETYITRYIYSQLLSSGYRTEEINFETIINVIEELIVHYSNFDSLNRINSSDFIPSLHKVFFDAKFEDEIFNFDVVGGCVAHGFRLEIPKGEPYPLGSPAVSFETPKQMFLQLHLAELITAIIKEIQKYSYRRDNKWNVLNESNSEFNSLFVKWIKSFGSNAILRMYTLNYDRNFKILLEHLEEPIKLFEGFDWDSDIDYEAKINADINKILNDFDSNTHYNLHGSIFWEVIARNQNQLINPQFYLIAYPFYPEDSYEQAIWQSERAKSIMITNIITGYQKTQRGIFSPFKQMQAAFDKDCCTADKIFIIGYSFGDEHINASIRTALQFNPNAQIFIVDPSFITNNIQLYVALKIFSSIDMNYMSPFAESTGKHFFFHGKVYAYTINFKDYLLNATNDPEF